MPKIHDSAVIDDKILLGDNFVVGGELRPSAPDHQTLLTITKEDATIGPGAIIGCDLEFGQGSVMMRTTGTDCLAIGNPVRVVEFVCRFGHSTTRFRRIEVAPVVAKVNCHRIDPLDARCVMELVA